MHLMQLLRPLIKAGILGRAAMLSGAGGSRSLCGYVGHCSCHGVLSTVLVLEAPLRPWQVVAEGVTFTDYRPAKLSYGAPHPDPVVETASLAAVEPPDVTYELHLQVWHCLQV